VSIRLNYLSAGDLEEIAMINPTPPEAPEPSILIRELDHRKSDGIAVTLLWNARTKAVYVSVVEERSGASFQFEVAPAAALDAFHHPYAYAAYGHHDDDLAA
jgi:hypothetical protein